MRVAFFGGSFDPPHVAHLLAVSYLLSIGAFERVLVVPVYAHAFDKRLAPFPDRLHMCQIAMAWLPRVEVSDIESSLDVPSLTLRSLKHIGAQHADYELRLAIGADVLQDARKWHGFEQVARIAPPFVLGRVGYPHPHGAPSVLPDVSSTQIRRLLVRRDDPGAQDQLRSLVPLLVMRYIEERGLYR